MFARAIVRVVALTVLGASPNLVRAQDGPQGDPSHIGARETRAPQDNVSPEPAHLEVPRDERIVVPRAGRATTPAVPRIRNGSVSVQVNVNAAGNNIVGDAANEPSIAVDPTDPTRMVIGWRQFDTIQSDFRQAGWAHSQDGGQTWTFPGVIQPGVFRSDPVLDTDADGIFYFNSLSASGDDFWCHVFRSVDGGMTWGGGTYAYGGDKQWMAIDRTDGIGRGNIYAYWTRAYSACTGQFTRSYDGGQTFLPCINVPGNPLWGTLAVGPDGELYVAGDGFVVAKSSTLQDPGQSPHFDFVKTVSLGGSMVGWGGPNPVGLHGQLWIAVDHSNGPTRGNVYLCCSVAPYSGADPLDIRFSRSTDGGSTWSAPVRINDDPTENGAYQWFGTMSVAPNGRIDVIWNDTRNDPGGYDSEVFYASSMDAGVTWSPNRVLTPPFNPHLGWPRQNKIGDYFDMVSDNRGADLAYAATFNGEQDVYYLRIPADCNANGVADEADIFEGSSTDCNADFTPDECEPDCNANGVADECDVVEGTSANCNGDGIPDECQVAASDCNANQVIDSCDVDSGYSPDCNDDRVPDECQLQANDCNANGIPDECDVSGLIAAGPISQQVCDGVEAQFDVDVAPGAILPVYQWQKRIGSTWEDLEDIPGLLIGATTATLTLSGAQSPNDAGDYRCRVSDGCIEATSGPATLSFAFAPWTILHPSSAEACEESNGGFTAVFGGTAVAYQWESSQTPEGPWNELLGKTSPDLLLTNVTGADQAYYRCRADNQCGQAHSNIAFLQVNAKPDIVEQPESTCAEIGGRAVLSVSALTLEGEPYPFGYEWYHGSTVVGSGSPILVIDVGSAADAGNYYVKVFSGADCRRFSTAATVQVGGCGPCYIPGDIDEDADVDLADFAMLQACWGGPATGDCECADIAVDSTVDLADFDLWAAEFAVAGPL